MCTDQTLRFTLIFTGFTYLPSGRYLLNMALSKSDLLESAVEILARGEPLTLDAVARASGLTKPGVIHHVGSKEGLMVAVVDHVIDRWTEDLDARLPSDATDVDRLAAYVDHAVSTDFDPSDLAPLADIRLRETLRDRWTEKLSSWLVASASGPLRARRTAARLLADGAWFNSAAGIETMSEDERAEVRRIAQQLIFGGEIQ